MQQKIDKTNGFLDAATLLMGEVVHDAVVSLCVSDAINASDALIVGQSGSFPSGPDHGSAVTILRRMNEDAASRQLATALALKNKAQYLATAASQKDEEAAFKAASRLVDKVNELWT